MVVKRQHAEAVRLAAGLAAWLLERHVAVLGEQDLAALPGIRVVDKTVIALEADLVVTLGGDGTLLRIARLAGARELRVLGVNLGGLGFLTEVSIAEAREAIARVLAGEFRLDRRATLAVRVLRAGRVVSESQALNDAVINQSAVARIFEL
jgi:NAD+ kinase